MGCGKSTMDAVTYSPIAEFGKTMKSDSSKGRRFAEGQTGIGAAQARQYTEKAVQGMQPYADVGTEALDMYRNMVLGGDTSSFQTSPGYQFRLGEGVNALEQGAAARGGLLSGAQQKALTQYGQGIGSEEYANYMNSVGNLMNQGYGAAGQQGGYYSGLGSQVGSMYSQLGQTGASMYGARAQQKTQMLGMGAEAGGAGIGAMSDKKVKENIEYTDKKTGLDIPIVEFNYKEGYGDNKRYRGVIAQDVEKIKPEAVTEIDGIKRVNYDMINFKMEEI